MDADAERVINALIASAKSEDAAAPAPSARVSRGPSGLAGAAMTVDEVRARAAHYRTLTQREDIDPAIRECLLNLATIYEAYLSRLDKEAARRMRHRRRAKARCVDCGRPLGKMVADNGVEYTPMDFAEPVTFMQLAALGERLPAAGSRCGVCVTALLRRSSVTMPLTARPAIAAPTPVG
jgi:hypothetical protein